LEKSIAIVKRKMNRSIVIEEKVKNKSLRIKRMLRKYKINRLNKTNPTKKKKAIKIIIKNQLKSHKIESIRVKIIMIKNTKKSIKNIVIKNINKSKRLNNKLMILLIIY